MFGHTNGRSGSGAVLGLAVALAGATLVPDLRPVIPFRLERAVVCRSQRGGLPVDPGESFEVGGERICIWFGGSEGTRATPVRASVWREDPERQVAICDLLVPRSSGGGLFSLTLRSGEPLPVGNYRVELACGDDTRQVRFRVVAGIADVPLAGPPGSETIVENPEEGFSIAVPTGWETTALEEAALALIHAGEPQAVVMVIVRHESRPTTTAAMAEQLAHSLGAESDYRVVGRRTGSSGDRVTATLIVDRKDGDRFKVVVVPRGTGRSVRTFYGVVVTCDVRAFAAVESDFDRMVRSFKVFSPRLP